MEDEKEMLNELLGYITEYYEAVKKIPTEPYMVTINYKYFGLYDKLTKDYNLARCAHITPEGVIHNINKRLDAIDKILTPKGVSATPSLNPTEETQPTLELI